MTVPYPKRHALGLPPGSVRGILTFLVVALLCLELAFPTPGVLPIPPYLIYLLFMALGHFFAAHGSSIAPAGTNEPSPLYLPAGTLRWLITLSLIGVVAWRLYTAPEQMEQQFAKSLDDLKDQPYLPLLLLGGFFAGIIFRTIIGRTSPPYVVQDLEAWVSIVAMTGLTADAIIHFIINPSLTQPLSLPDWGAFLAVVVAFYFGARS
jgi:hypothetical protein